MVQYGSWLDRSLQKQDQKWSIDVIVKSQSVLDQMSTLITGLGMATRDARVCIAPPADPPGVLLSKLSVVSI